MCEKKVAGMEGHFLDTPRFGLIWKCRICSETKIVLARGWYSGSTGPQEPPISFNQRELPSNHA